MSTGTLYRPNTAAVVRDNQHHIFTTSPFTGDNHSIVHTTCGDDSFDARQTVLTIDGEMVRTVENTPLAATICWDNTQINLYYFTTATDGNAFLREVCQRDGDWSEDSLGDFLVKEGAIPHKNSTVTVWNEKEQIHVYFKSSTDGEKEMTLAKLFSDEGWQLKKIRSE